MVFGRSCGIITSQFVISNVVRREKLRDLFGVNSYKISPHTMFGRDDKLAFAFCRVPYKVTARRLKIHPLTSRQQEFPDLP